MTHNMTTCPECGAAFDTVAQEKDLPLQALQQECPDCEYDVGIAIVNFWDHSYEVVSPALPGDECDARVSTDEIGYETCGDDAMIRCQRVGYAMEARCAEHFGAHRESAMDLRQEL